MPLGSTSFWALILPVEKTNLVTNPSLERGTTGWGTIQAGTIGTTSAFQQFGGWAGSIAPTSNGTTGAMGPTFTAGDGTAYTFSAYVKGQNGIPYKLGVGDSNGANIVGSTNFTGGGTWHRYVGSWTESGGATRRLVIKKNADADTGAIYIDGAQVEAGSLTTYIDGQQDGCIWLGQPHASASLRSGTYRGGGSVVALADLGLRPDQHVGIGMPPQEITALSFALQPGAEYQRSRAAERPFTIAFKPILGTTQKDYHVTRRTIINALKPDLVDPQQPVRFWYTGGEGTAQIDAVYAGGLELGEMNGPMAEEGAIRFVAHDPYWYTTTDQGTSLACRQALGSANAIVARDPLGRWGTLGANGSSVDGKVEAMAIGTDQTIFLGGSWGSVAGTNYPNIARYTQSTNTFGTLLGGTVTSSGLGGASAVRSLAVSPDNTLYVGGNFLTAGGTVARHIAKYTTQWGTLTGGTIAGNGTTVIALLYSSTGTLFVAGNFDSVGGTTARNAAQWVNAAWGTLRGQTSGTIDTTVFDLALDQRQTLYLAGAFTMAGGTTANGLALWRGSFGTFPGGALQNGAGQGFALSVAPDQRLYIGGGFGSAGGGSAQHVAVYNGVQLAPLGSGVGTALNAGVSATTCRALPDGRVFFAGQNWQGSASGVPLPDNAAIWNGATFLPLDIDINGANDASFLINDALFTPSGTLYLGGLFVGTAQAAAVAQVVNTGIGEAYPTIVIRNISASAIQLYQIANTLTGDYLCFNLSIAPSEEFTLRTTPGKRSFTSSFRGNSFGNIVGGSNIASFRLMPGTNYISMFANSGSLATSIYWRARSDSVDGGTIY